MTYLQALARSRFWQTCYRIDRKKQVLMTREKMGCMIIQSLRTEEARQVYGKQMDGFTDWRPVLARTKLPLIVNAKENP